MTTDKEAVRVDALTTVWIVQGSCGGYSDYTDHWMVRAFGSEDAARQFADLCEREGKQCYAKRKASARVVDKSKILPSRDPGYREGYAGPPYYTVHHCPFTQGATQGGEGERT